MFPWYFSNAGPLAMTPRFDMGITVERTSTVERTCLSFFLFMLLVRFVCFIVFWADHLLIEYKSCFEGHFIANLVLKVTS